MKKTITTSLLTMMSVGTLAGPHYQSGNISNLTAEPEGIMIMLDSGLPDNCKGSLYGWMQIKKEDTPISSVVLAAWASGKKAGTVYTDGIPDNSAYCVINQFDPNG